MSTVLIPRLFRNIGSAKTNSAGILKTEVGSIIDFRSVRSLNDNLLVKEQTDYVSFKINTDNFTVTSLTSSYGKIEFLSSSNITGSSATFTFLTSSQFATTFLTSSNIVGTRITSSFAKITQITGSHQKLIDGTNAYIPGPGIIIQNHFNGSIGISSSLAFTALKSSAYSASVGDVVLAFIANGSFTVNLPDATIASNKNGEIVIKIKGIANGNTLTIDAFNTQTIDDITTKTLTTDYAFTYLKCDGSNWFII